MSRRESIELASRALALLLAIWALGEASGLPRVAQSFLHYANQETGSSSAIQYWRHYYLISLGFLLTRIIGFSLMARWLYKGGTDVEELLLPQPQQGSAEKLT